MKQLNLFTNKIEDIPVMIKISPKTKPDDFYKAKAIAQLRTSAESAMKKAYSINTAVSGSWTHRRQSFANNALKKQETLIKWSRVLQNLATAWQNDTIPECMKKIRTTSHVEYIMYWGYPNPPSEDAPSDGWYRKEYPDRLRKAQALGMNSEEDQDLMREYINEYAAVILTEAQRKAETLRVKLIEARSFNIPGFYPTPDGLVDKMIDYAHLEDGMTLLEPSAGIGNILDRIAHHGFKCLTWCVEISPSMIEILNLKGYSVTCSNVFEYEPAKKFDRILMNPPFEKGQDVEHVMHCFDHFLKSGGRLVAIMSATVKSHTGKKYAQFREFLEENSGDIYDNGQQFKDAFVSTGVSTVMIVIDKP